MYYCMHCKSLLSENSGQISLGDSNTECMQIEFELWKLETLFKIPSLDTHSGCVSEQ